MVGTIASMIGSQTKANSEAHAAHVKAGIDYAEARVNQSGVVAQYNASKINEEQQLGSVRASYGASGVTMSGSAVDTINSQAGIMNSKIAQESLAGTLKTNVLNAEGDAEMRAAEDAQSEGVTNAFAIGFGGFMKGAAAAAG